MPKTWTRNETPRSADAAGYLERVKSARDVFPNLPWLPELPETMDCLTHEGANDIELVLLGVGQAIDRMEDSWFFSGEIDAGGF